MFWLMLHVDQVRGMLREIYGAEGETKAYVNWRLFFLTLVCHTSAVTVAHAGGCLFRD